jgi:hypothetical protein
MKVNNERLNKKNKKDKKEQLKNENQNKIKKQIK